MVFTLHLSMPAKVFSGFLIVLLLCFSARHLMFKHYLGSQKNKFRLELYKSAHPEVFTIQINEEALFKDVNGILWKDQNKEIIYEGLYHEVLHIVCFNGIAHISLIEDAFENKLIASFYNALSKDDNLYNILSELLQLKFVYAGAANTVASSSERVNYPAEDDTNNSSKHTLMVYVPPKA